MVWIRYTLKDKTGRFSVGMFFKHILNDILIG